MKTFILFLTLLCLHSVHSQTLFKPNILLLLSDDQAWNGLSVQMHPDMEESKNPLVQTPNLEKLASQGMRFSAAYAPSFSGTPSRASLQTGKSPAQSRWTKDFASLTAEDGFKLIPPPSLTELSGSEYTIAEMLQSAGYLTAHYGKWGLGGGGPENHGFAYSDGDIEGADPELHVEPNSADIYGMGQRAMKLMEQSQAQSQPFFIQMSYHALDHPETASKALIEKYRNLLPNGNAREIGRAAIAEELDKGVGQLLDKLDDLMLSRTTYVIYLSDNGFPSKGLRMKGLMGGLWEGRIRVPMIVRGPGVLANTWCHERVVGFDLYPTFCQLAGVQQSMPETVEGGSLSSIFRGSSLPVKRPRKELVFHFPHYQGEAPHSALFSDNYKLMRFYEDNSTQLYDISQDIQEANDLSETLPDVASSLLTKMNEHLIAVQAAFPLMNPKYDPLNPPSVRTTFREPKEPKTMDRPGMVRKPGRQGGQGGPLAGNPNKPQKGFGKNQRKDRQLEGRQGAPAVAPDPAPAPVSSKPTAFSDPKSWLPANQAGLDVNGDGNLALTELMNDARTSFYALDTDQNGYLSTAEYQGKTTAQGLAGLLVWNANTFDVNSDTYITAMEFAQILKNTFVALDTNQDGNLSPLDAVAGQ